MMDDGVYLMDTEEFLEFMEVLNEYYSDGDTE